MSVNPYHDSLKESSKRRVVLWVMIACLLSAWLWASVARIDQQVRGEGSIVPSGQPKIIQHLEGGIVVNIFVEEGQSVAVDQPLFQISNQQAESETGEMKTQVYAAQVQLRRLEAELNDKAEPDFTTLPPEIPDTIRQNEKQLFQSRAHDFQETQNVLHEQINQKKLKIDDLETQDKNLREQLDVARQQHEINENLYRSGAISQTHYLQSKAVVQDFLTRIGSVEKAIPVVQSELDEVERKISEVGDKRHSDILEDIKKTRLSLDAYEQRVKTPEDKMHRTLVTSPIKGIVNKLFITTKGGVVRPGDKLAELIPVDDTLIVEARIQTKDRGLVWNGLSALVKVSAYDYALYGGIPGVVTDISADTLADEHGVPYYRVRIALSKNKINDQMPLFPGMTADVNILSGKITVWQYLMRPVWKVSQNALREAK